mmetsp:Transcript_49651/g.130942  ORF Transcript_49651/g.130942 Transcript_49651/m.130942 type:complete len:143 (-) Transcript_49651:66-494(-)
MADAVQAGVRVQESPVLDRELAEAAADEAEVMADAVQAVVDQADPDVKAIIIGLQYRATKAAEDARRAARAVARAVDQGGPNGAAAARAEAQAAREALVRAEKTSEMALGILGPVAGDQIEDVSAAGQRFIAQVGELLGAGA